MADFIPRMWDDNAVTAYLKRYIDSEREIAAAKKRLERLEFQANRDKRYATGPIRDAIDEDRNRISERMITAETVKSEVIDLLSVLPNGDEFRALELYYIAGMSIADIADTLHYSDRSVCNLKERGVKMIIDYIGGCNNAERKDQNNEDREKVKAGPENR